MSDSNPGIGWDLIYKIVESSLNQKSDVIVAVIHWLLILKGYKSIGIGTDVSS